MADPTYDIYAEREACEPLLWGEGLTLSAAAALLEETDGTEAGIPEGYDAVARHAVFPQRWLYTGDGDFMGGWEPA